MSTVTFLPQRRGMTAAEATCIGQGARSISPSWGASFVRDEDSESLGGVSIGATSGGSERFDVSDTYWIARVGPNQVQLDNSREGTTIGTFRTVPEAVEAMKAHAAAVRY